MIVSICICTHNRADDVAECLQALVPQVDPARGEVLIVDSASEPAAAARLAALAQSHPGTRLVRLEEPGLSLARNAGVAAAQGAWIAFVDDDAVPFPDYFAALLSAIRRSPPQVAFFGGRLKPRWPAGARPVGERWSRLLSLIDDPRERETELGLIYGANLVYSRDVLAGFAVPFDPSFGRTGKNLMSGEEIKLHFALKDKGFKAYYYGTVGVEHKITPGRLETEWVRQRAFWEGVTLVALTQRLGHAYPRGAKVYWQLLKVGALLPRTVLGDRDRDAYIRLWQSIGVIRARVMGVPAGETK